MKIGGRETSSPGILVSGYGIRNTKKCGGRGRGPFRHLLIGSRRILLLLGWDLEKEGVFGTLMGLFMSDFHRIDTLA